MPAPQFVHLRVHSDFSMVDGLAKTKPIVAKAEELQMPALAITDQMNLCGLVRFYGAAHGAAGDKLFFASGAGRRAAQVPQ